MTEQLYLHVTTDGFTEHFYAKAINERLAVVDNVLLTGIISYGDVVAYNEHGQVTELTARSGRLNIHLAPVIDEDNISQAVEWEDTCQAGLARLFELVPEAKVERGWNHSVYLSIPSDYTGTSDDADLDAVEEYLRLFEGSWELTWAAAGAAGDPTDAEWLELTQPEVEEREVSVVITDDDRLRLIHDLTTVAPEMWDALVEGGHVNASVELEDAINRVAWLITTDLRMTNAWRSGHMDRVIVFAARLIAMEQGLLVPILDGPIESTNFLEMP